MISRAALKLIWDDVSMPARTASGNTPSAALYDEDFLLRTERTAELLRAGRLDEVDIEHVAEESHDIGVSQRREALSRLRALLTHLIQWKIQPDRRSRSWSNTIETQRDELLRRTPSTMCWLKSASA
jgi:hypothetical protein